MSRFNASCCPVSQNSFWRILGIATIWVGLGVGSIFIASEISKSAPVMAASESSKVLRHVVQFQFKEESSSADVQKVVDAFRALPEKISEVAGFEYGTNNSPEGLADGFTHCFLVSFKSEEDRAAYIVHSAHQAFVSVLKPHLSKVQVIDFWSTK